MRKLFIAGNWKMNKNAKEAVSLAGSLKNRLKNVKDKDILICPAFTFLCCVHKEIKNSNIKLGAQDMHYEDKGAYTGEISPLMLKDFCEYVILGHSERRQFFNETDDIVNKKIKKALEHGLKPILCIGETSEQREKNKTLSVIKTQLKNSLKSIGKNDIKKMIIAYEPIWAISGGDPNHKAATADDAQEMHAFVRKVLADTYSEKIANEMRIIYGGSMKPENVKELMAQPDIDGGLLGGASLEAESFSDIVNY